eukprot:TRINITY_DN4501_c0_g1_i1.p1 TRINITY_DN4501_c0_g1~~TRINITY_DN4501_c0_g1_i1.p1  ORF type:complete len:298 (-),score=32.16 TRINITY_DN4501_c0_g1_i1:305-1198(-)
MTEAPSDQLSGTTGLEPLPLSPPDVQTSPETNDIPFYHSLYCSICVTSKDNGITLSCGHIFCHECLKEYIRMQIFTGGVLDINCMDLQCRLPIAEDEVGKIVEEDAFEKYKQFKFSVSRLWNPNMRWCPTPDCNTLVEKKDSSKKMSCTKCCKAFCFDCNEKWHPDVSCADYMKELRKMKKVDVKSEKMKQCAGRKCPGCSIIIQRKEGCNHVVCSYCRYEFCWICMKEFKADHYFVGACEGLQFSKFPNCRKREEKLQKVENLLCMELASGLVLFWQLVWAFLLPLSPFPSMVFIM